MIQGIVLTVIAAIMALVPWVALIFLWRHPKTRRAAHWFTILLVFWLGISFQTWLPFVSNALTFNSEMARPAAEIARRLESEFRFRSGTQNNRVWYTLTGDEGESTAAVLNFFLDATDFQPDQHNRVLKTQKGRALVVSGLGVTAVDTGDETFANLEELLGNLDLAGTQPADRGFELVTLARSALDHQRVMIDTHEGVAAFLVTLPLIPSMLLAAAVIALL